MNFKSLNQPLTPKRAMMVLAGIALLVGLYFGGRFVYNVVSSGPASPASAKKTIRKYLQKEAQTKKFEADFDLQLKEKVAAMQTNAFQLRQKMNLLQTNVVSLRAEGQTMRRELATLQEQAHSLKTQAQNQDTDVTDKQRRLNTRQQELATAQTNVMRYETNLLATKQTVAEAQTALGQLTNEVSTLQTNQAKLQADAAVVQTNLATLQADAKTKARELLVKQRELKNLNADLVTKQAKFEALKNAAAAAQTNVFLAQSNLLGAQKTLETKRAALEAKQKETTAKEEALTAKQKELAARQSEFDGKQKELTGLQRELANKQQLLTRQYAVYAQEVRKKVAEAGSYQAIYLQVGQQLWLADRFLEGKEPEPKRDAIRLVMEASGHAAQAAENYWLAARICEAYLWPNLDLVDAKGARLHNPEDVLQVCGNAFQRAAETNNIIKNFELTLKYTTNDLRADAVRYALGNVYERVDRLEDALKCFRGVQSNTNYIKYAEQRLANLEQRRKQMQGAKK